MAHCGTEYSDPSVVKPPPHSIVVRVSARGAGRPGFDPRPRHTKDVKNGRFASQFGAWH